MLPCQLSTFGFFPPGRVISAETTVSRSCKQHPTLKTDLRTPRRCRPLDGCNRFWGARRDGEDFSLHRTFAAHPRLVRGVRRAPVPPLPSTKGSCKPISAGRMVQALGSGLGSCSGDTALPPEDTPGPQRGPRSARPSLRSQRCSPLRPRALIYRGPAGASSSATASGHLQQPCAGAGAVNLLGLCCFHLHGSLIYFFIPFQCLQPQLSKIAYSVPALQS